jgi:hypothetical protein
LSFLFFLLPLLVFPFLLCICTICMNHSAIAEGAGHPLRIYDHWEGRGVYLDVDRLIH